AGQRRHAGTAAPESRGPGGPAPGRSGKGRWPAGLKLHTKLLSLVLAAALLLCLPTALRRIEEQIYPCRYAGVIEGYAAAYEMDPLLIYAFVRTESGFDPEAVSSVGARGLMQMTEETFEWIKTKIAPDEPLTFDDLFDPACAVRFGAYYLRLCLDRYGGDVATAAAAYHSGWGTVDSLLHHEDYTGDGKTLPSFPYSRMNHYVEKILRCYKRYTELYGPSI